MNIKIEPGYRLQVTFMDGSTGSHESTDNIPGRDVIRGLPYGAFIISGIDTHRHGCWVYLSKWLRSGRIDGSIFEALREEDFFRLAAVEYGQ